MTHKSLNFCQQTKWNEKKAIQRKSVKQMESKARIGFHASKHHVRNETSRQNVAVPERGISGFLLTTWKFLDNLLAERCAIDIF